jgi:hypothetical protein
VRQIAEEDPYAALLISMHTYSLLSEHADRSTIAPQDLPPLDEFLERQREFQGTLRARITAGSTLPAEQISEAAVVDHFRLLQATDNLSLLTCVDFRQPANLLHPLPLHGGGHARVEVRSAGSREFVLEPYPFGEPSLTFEFPARHVTGKVFASGSQLQRAFASAPVETLSVTVRSS